MTDPWGMPKGPFWSASRVWSLVVFILEWGLASRFLGAEQFQQRVASYSLAPSILGLMCIWFPEQLSRFRGYVGLGRFVDRETPEEILFYAGWIALFVPFGLWLLTKLAAG